jgi:prefoldin subunit 5
MVRTLEKGSPESIKFLTEAIDKLTIYRQKNIDELNQMDRELEALRKILTELTGQPMAFPVLMERNRK